MVDEPDDVPPQDGDTDSFACDGCGHGIVTTYSQAEQLWVGDYVVLANEMIYHPGCVQELVDEALHNAKSSGYPVLSQDPGELAIELGTYDQTFEGTIPELLLPFVQAWQQENKAF